MSKQPIVVIMGGPSREHDISIKSGSAMITGLDSEKYDVTKAEITKDSVWLWGEDAQSLSAGQALRKISKEQAIVLIGLHGSFGEDGTLQALLELHNISYTGSGVAASMLAMDKSTSNSIYTDNGLQVPRSLVFGEANPEVAEIIQADLGAPVVIKPVRQGSSVGVHVVKDAKDLQAAIDDAFSHDQQIMAQAFIKGREVSCGVLQKGDELVPLPPTEIIPVVSEFFDYKAKYTVGGSKEVTPAEMPADTLKAIQDIAIAAHTALGCKTYSRTDVMVSEDGLYVIETNTLPGMTETSILPQQAQAVGMTFGELLDHIIAGATKEVY
jgi:D-alanine-D-alanine ligase